MNKITRLDLLIILKAAFQMAQQDSKIVTQEKEFLEEMMSIGNIEIEEIRQFRNFGINDISILANHLSSDRAKKVFLLTLASIAMIDELMDISEAEMLNNLTEKLNVGRVKLNKVSSKYCKEMIFQILADVHFTE